MLDLISYQLHSITITVYIIICTLFFLRNAVGPTNTAAVSGIEAQHLAVQTGQGMFLVHSRLL